VKLKVSPFHAIDAYRGGAVVAWLHLFNSTLDVINFRSRSFYPGAYTKLSLWGEGGQRRSGIYR